jgi:pyruvate/2-oxoglutarate dehydrogenase complex dihydrolipoamide acyltransferase (E2) component
MIYAMVVPDSFEDLAEMRVLEWHGKPGDVFSQGDLIVELETHKVVVEARAGAATILRRILRNAGEWQKLGGAIALFSDHRDEELPDSPDGLARQVIALEIV